MSDEGCDQTAFLYCLMQDLTDTLEFSIPEATDAITPEEREELKVSGQCWFSNLPAVPAESWISQLLADL